MKRFILSFILLGALIGPAVTSAEGLSVNINPRVWLASTTQGAKMMPLYGISATIGHSSSDFSVTTNYLTGSDGKGETGKLAIWNWRSGQVTNVDYTVMEVMLNWMFHESAQLFAGVINSDLSELHDFFGAVPNEIMTEKYTMGKVGVSFSHPISDNGRHSLFGLAAHSAGNKNQSKTGSQDLSVTSNGIDLQVGYIYNLEDIGGINLRYRHLSADGGEPSLNRNWTGFEAGVSFGF